jgi:hypothetical protein
MRSPTQLVLLAAGLPLALAKELPKNEALAAEKYDNGAVHESIMRAKHVRIPCHCTTGHIADRASHRGIVNVRKASSTLHATNHHLVTCLVRTDLQLLSQATRITRSGA